LLFHGDRDVQLQLRLGDLVERGLKAVFRKKRVLVDLFLQIDGVQVKLPLCLRYAYPSAMMTASIGAESRSLIRSDPFDMAASLIGDGDRGGS